MSWPKLRPRPGTIVMLLGLYLAYGAAMSLAQPYFLYPFSHEEIPLHVYQRVMVDVPGAEPVRVVLTDPGSVDAPVVLFFMGNAGNIGYFIPWLNLHQEAGRRVVAMEYRGGGGNPGRPSEARLKADALAVYDWAQAEYGVQTQLIVHGYSLGTGLAIHVAANRPVSGIILDAPFARICDLMQRAAYLPACSMPWVQKWDSLSELAALVGEKVTILHGVEDHQIPISEGHRLEAALRDAGAEVVFQSFSDGTHSNLPKLAAYPPALEAAVASFPKTR